MDQNEPQTELTVSQILARRAQTLAQVLESDAAIGQTLQLIRFQLGDEQYALPIDQVLEIQPLTNWARVPCTPNFIVGAVNLRGRIYSLMDVAFFFGLPERPPAETAHVLLVQGENRHIRNTRLELCLLVDDLPQEVQVAISEVDTTSSTLSSHTQEYILGVTGKMLIVLDLERLLASAEIIVTEDV